MSVANCIEAPFPKERSVEEMEEMMKYLQTAIADKKTATQEAKQLTDDDIKQLLFEGSTHRFLFLDTIKNQDDGTEYKVGRWNKFIALVVIALQFFSYIQVMALFSGYLYYCPEQTTPIPTPLPTTIPPTSILSGQTGPPTMSPITMSPTRPPIANGWIPPTMMSPTGSPTVSPTMSPTASPTASPIPPKVPIQKTEDVLCDVESFTELLNKFYYIPAFLLLFCFLSQDIFEGVVLFRCKGCMAKLMALFIFLEAAFAVVTACIGAILGFTSEGSGAVDTFLWIVGIIFVHEVDEQIGYWKNVQRRMGSKYPYSEGIVWTVLVFLGACVLILWGLFTENSLLF